MNCCRRFLELLSDKTLTIAHKISYDFFFLINHLTSIHNEPIIMNGRVLQIQGIVRHQLMLLYQRMLYERKLTGKKYAI